MRVCVVVSPLILYVLVLLFLFSFVSGRFTGEEEVLNTLVLPSVNIIGTVLVCRRNSDVGEITQGRDIVVTLILPSLNRIFFWFCLILISDVGEIHRVVDF